MMSSFKASMVAAFMFLAIVCVAVLAKDIADGWGWLR